MKAKIARWYSQGLWTDAMVRAAAEKNVIAAADYEEITLHQIYGLRP